MTYVADSMGEGPQRQGLLVTPPCQISPHMMWKVGEKTARPTCPQRFHCIWRACVDHRMNLW